MQPRILQQSLGQGLHSAVRDAAGAQVEVPDAGPVPAGELQVHAREATAQLVRAVGAVAGAVAQGRRQEKIAVRERSSRSACAGTSQPLAKKKLSSTLLCGAS